MTSAAVAAIVPSRGRPGSLAELLEDFGDTAVCSELVICLDDDDPELGAYRDLARQPRFARHPVTWHAGPRNTLTGWTNAAAATLIGQGTQAIISLGDDHRPVTAGWDRKLLEAARAMGGGWAYGDDGLQHENLPTAFLVTANVAAALGWVLLPACRHMFVDAAARDLAEACGRRAYLPDVHVRHLHYTSGLSGYDQTYAGGYASWPDDEAAYRAWLADDKEDGEGLAAAVKTVREALR